MTNAAEYVARIRGYAQGQDPLAMQRRTPEMLVELLANVSDAQLATRPSADKWSVGEILAHLAEGEIATAWRYRQMVEHNGLELDGYDQDLWARLGGYDSRPPRESFALFRLLRGANLQFLKALAPQQWECFGMHVERGRMTVRELATHMAGHDVNHVEQVRRILERHSSE